MTESAWVHAISNNGFLPWRHLLAGAAIALSCGTTVFAQVNALRPALAPTVGDRWTYRVQDVNSERRRYQISVEVQEVTASSITDVLRPENGAATVQTHKAGAFLTAVAPGVASFSPYLGAFQTLEGSEKWAAVDFRQLWECDIGLINCNPAARVAGRERVTVPAGTFNAWKIIVDLKPWMGASATGNGELTFWLSDEVRRVVKYQSRVKFDVGAHYSWPQPDIDMELLSYVPAAGRASAPVATTPPATTERARSATANRLEELENLRQRGLVTQDEYVQKRKAILQDF